MEYPEVNEFVELTFEGEYGSQSPVQGRVTDVETDPEIEATSLVFVVNDEEGGRKLVYGEGVHNGEEWSNVTVHNRNLKLGENASWRRLE